MDRSFEDLLEGPDYTTTWFRDGRTAELLGRVKLAGGLVLMMADIVILEKCLGRKYDPVYDAPHRNLEYNPWGANPNSPTYPYELEPSPRKWVK